MIYRTLGRTGLKVSVMGMGTGGADDPLGQASGRPEKEIHELLHRAFDLGINLFDTSPGYMDSELILGRALKSLPRDQLLISTKVSLGGDEDSVKPAEAVASVERSLKRLQVDYVDILLITVGGGVEHFDAVMNEHLPVLRGLKAEGKIRFLGSSEFSRKDGDHQWLQCILPTDMLDVAMVAHNLINQSAQQLVFPLCQKLDLGVINVFTVRRALGNIQRLKAVLAELVEQELVSAADIGEDDTLGWLLEDDDTQTIIEAAYRYAAYTEGVTAVMNGANSIPWLEQNVENIQKGPLRLDKIERLRQIFGCVNVPVGN